MKYRKCPKNGEQISVLGLGGNYLSTLGEEEGVAIIRTAYERGVNFFDLATSEAETFPLMGKALADVRENIRYQIHFGADYRNGTYARTYKLEDIKEAVAWQLKQLQTDYIDYGMIHCIDEDRDWRAFLEDGILDYMLELKEQGVIRHLGASTHTPRMANLMMDAVDLDMLMFSINPAYDDHHGRYALGSADEREALYRRCEVEGVGISVMKPFSAGMLFDGEKSPFGKPLTLYQCVQYALDKPAVVTVLPGFTTVKELEEYLSFETASAEERDYSILEEMTVKDVEGRCLYCSHCQPCPAGIDIALVNKYYDIVLSGDEQARSHYLGLEKTASYCIACGSCNQRCPFHVNQLARMKEMAKYFGEM